MSVVGSVSSKYYSGFNPLDIGDCALWLDAADSSTLTLSGTNVTQWRDKSGNGAHATPLAGATAGVYTPNSFNSIYPSVFFNVSKYSGTYPTNTGTTLTGFFVGDLSVSATNTSRVISLARSGVSDFSNSTTTAMLTVSTSGTRRYRTERTPLLVNYSTPTINQASIVAVIFDGTNCLFYANGNLIATNASSGSFNISSYAIGSGVQDNAGQLIGNVAEIILYNSAVTTAQRQQIEGYLLWKWGFQATSLAFSPTSISGCALWLDAADSTTFSFSSGSNISQWRDKTSSITFTNFTGTPTLSNGFRNGNAVVSLSGTSSLNNTTLVWPNTNYSVFVVAYQQSLSANWSRLLNGGGGAVDSYLFLGTFNGTPNYATFTGNGSSWNDTGSNTPATSILQSWLVLQMTVGGSTLTPYINGIDQNTKTGTTGAFTGLNIGGVYNTNQTSQCFQGFVGEVIVYNSVLSTTQRQQVEEYLMKKWVSPVPITHPYSSIIPLTRAFAPVDVPGLQLWLDAADPSTLTLSGTSVTAWRDKSSNNYSSTVFNSPTYSSSSLNGLPGITFNGTSQYMNFGNVLNIGTSSIYVFVISKFDSTANGGIIGKTSARGGVTGRWALYRFASDGGLGYLFDNSNAATSGFVADSSTEPRLLTLYWDRSNSFLFQNGSQIITRTFAYTSNFTGTDPLYVAAYPNSTATAPAFYFPGKIGEILVYLGSLTTIQRQQVEAYLARKWGLIGGGMQTITTFNPTNVSGCALWLDAADSNSFTFSSGSNISQWRDKSPNNYTGAANGTPTLTENIQNGLPVVTFNGSTQYFDFGNVNNIGTNQLNIFTVAKFNTTGNGTIIAKSLAGGGLGRYSLLRENSVLIPLIQGGSLVSAQGSGVSDTSTATRILGMVWDRTNDYIFINGTQSFITTFIDSTNLTNTYNLLIGAYNNTTGTTPPTSGLYLNGYIMEIMVYLGTVTTAQRQNIEGYLALKWGLQSSLPSTHPYALRGLPSTHPYLYRLPATTAFNPRQISGCALWLDAADPASMTLSGANVSQWNDKSGNGYNLTQSTDSARPLYDGSANAITFVSNRYLNIPQAAINNANSYALSFVFNPISASNYIFVKQHDFNNTYNALSMTFATNSGGASTTQSNQFLYWRTSNQGNQATTGLALSLQKQLVTLTFDETNMTMFVNGSQVSTQASTTFKIANVTNATAFTLGAWLTGAGLVVNNPANFQLHEMIFWSNGMFTYQRQQVEGYLAWKWGLNGGYSPSIAPFTPTSVSGCQLWLDAADSSTLTLSGSSVTQWNDKSGNNRNVTQSTVSPTDKRPTYDSTLRRVNFNGSQQLTAPTAAITDAGQTIILVASHTGTSGRVIQTRNTAQQSSLSLGSGTQDWLIWLTNSGINIAPVNVGSSATTMVTLSRNGFANSLQYNVNGGTVLSPALSYSQNTTGPYTPVLSIGASPEGGSGLNGYVNEIILYSGALSTTDRQTIEGYLANKWGLTGSLPSSHPYANRSLPNTHPYKVIQPGFVNSGTFVSTVLIFTYAWYGSTNGGSGKNVTSTVQSVYDSGAATITLGNSTFGDPQPGVPKYTWITYTKSGTSYSVGPYGEGTVLTFASL